MEELTGVFDFGIAHGAGDPFLPAKTRRRATCAQPTARCPAKGRQPGVRWVRLAGNVDTIFRPASRPRGTSDGQALMSFAS
jgi:hypothetical protein